MKKLLVAVALATTLIGTGTISRAADPAPDTASTAKKAKHMPFRGKVSAVDKTTMTITLEGKEKTRTFSVTAQTRIQKDGAPAVLDDVKVGETVGGAAVEGAGGKWEISTLNLGKKAAEAKPTTKKPSKKSKADESEAMP
jgi:hypothetical protein